MRSTRSISWLTTAFTVSSAHLLVAQNTAPLALNLSVVSSTQVGITYQMSRAVALRPALSVSWSKSRTSVNLGTGTVVQTESTSSRVGILLDALFVRPGDAPVIPYTGLGGGLSFDNSSGSGILGDRRTYSANALFGLRARVISRVFVYGELALRYSATRGSATDGDNVGLGTTPLGVLVYLK